MSTVAFSRRNLGSGTMMSSLPGWSTPGWWSERDAGRTKIQYFFKTSLFESGSSTEFFQTALRLGPKNTVVILTLI